MVASAPDSTSLPLAVFGGTFDPVHFGHLRVAWEAAEFLAAEVRMMPANVPPHRPQPVASAEQRLAMLRVALKNQDRLILDDRELRREGPSYTVDTLIDLRKEVGQKRAVVMLVGADAWSGLASWHRWKDLFELAHVGVLTRAGHEAHESPELARFVSARRIGRVTDLNRSAAGLVIDVPVSALEISATRIRNDLAAGREPRFLVPSELLADSALLEPYRNAAAPSRRGS